MSDALTQAANDWLRSADTESPSNVENLEWAIMGLAILRVDTGDFANLLPPIRIVFSTWLLEADVANGGWAQAALNNLEGFDLAATSYENLRRPDLTDLVRRAKAAALAEQATLDDSSAAESTTLTDYFQHSRMRTFDDESDMYCSETSWTWATPERLRYARRHSAVFEALGPSAAG